MTLPLGFVVELDRHTRVVDGGRALLGGHPTRLLKLTPKARRLLNGRLLPVQDAAGALLADRLLDTGMAHPVAGALPAPADPAARSSSRSATAPVNWPGCCGASARASR